MPRCNLGVMAAALLVPVLFPTRDDAQETNEILLAFRTGGDDLRGGNDNVNVVVLLRSGAPLRFDNVNAGKKWSNNSRVDVRRPLPPTLQFTDILGVRLEATVGGGPGGDNWNLDRLTVSARIGGVSRQLFDQKGTPLFRFTGNRRVRDFRFSPEPLPPVPRVMTHFDPVVHGFKFSNSFQNIVIVLPPNEVNFTTSGLCGGMSYTALDYFLAGRPIPEQDYVPAEGTPLQSYIYNRQVTSIVSNGDKWGEFGFNPGGTRNREFFEWGLQVGPGRLGELRSRIDGGQPVPLGLQACGDDCLCPGGCPGSHQVLAIGYEMGRYTGDVSEHAEDLAIFVCDPNNPRAILTLKPNVAGAHYYYAERPEKRWRAYFVDTKYQRSDPPTIASAPNELIVKFVTGSDDLRGDKDNVHVILLRRDGSPLRFPNVNGGKRWINNSSQTVALPLPADLRFEDIVGVRLETTFSGGMGGDNWNLNELVVSARIGGAVRPILTRRGTPLVRFTGTAKAQEFLP